MEPIDKTEEVKLTQFSRGSGCGCKIAPAVLESILGPRLPVDENKFPQLLVGNHLRDDAAAWDLGSGQALISTADFFMPVVDDPTAFGRIAAANALSDVYAMGGRPVMALALLGWPMDKIPAAVAGQVMAGGQSACAEAGVPLAGGHTIDSAEPFFGLAVSGLMETGRLKRNSTAKPGDLLYLTKPLGSGIISAAERRGEARPGDLQAAIRWMSALNRAGESLGGLDGVHAMTDVTGFGLLGHLAEMCRASGYSATLDGDRIPAMDGLSYYTDKLIYPDMTMKVYASVQEEVNELSPGHIFTLCDPQTNGGLLIAADPADANRLEAVLREAGVPAACLQPIGRITEPEKPLITVR